MKITNDDLKKIVKEEIDKQLNEESLTTSYGKDMRSVFYELGDKIYNLVDLGKNTKDYTISQHAVKIRSLFESLKKYLDKTYDWD